MQPAAARNILLLMQAEPIQEWQRLTGHYRQMSDEELLELGYDFSSLTETAQQVLRSEMKTRGLGDPQSARSAPESQPPKHPPQAPLPLRNASWAGDAVDIAFSTAFGASAPELVPDSPAADNEADGPHEYTWKTPLCECESSQEARQLSEVLKQAGIECWIQGPTSSVYSAYASSEMINPRVLVAADELERARAIAAQAIPQDIVEACAMQVPEFTPPKCPKCGAEDPVLVAVDPANAWRCEQCDEEWTESDKGGN